MTPMEGQTWLLGGGLAANILVSGLTAVWALAKRSGSTDSHEKSQNNALTDLKRQHAILEQLVNDARIKANSADEKIDSHEDRCALSYQELRTDMRAGFDRIEARLNAMGRAARGAE